MPDSTLPGLDRTPARRRFSLGDRVRLSAAGVRARLFRPGSPTTGEVTGFSRNGEYVRVRRSGRKTVTTYHPGYWEKEDADARD